MAAIMVKNDFLPSNSTELFEILRGPSDYMVDYDLFKWSHQDIQHVGICDLKE